MLANVQQATIQPVIETIVAKLDLGSGFEESVLGQCCTGR
jgi:hypothetical protein